MHKTLKSQGETIGRNILYEYLSYFEDAYLIFSVPIFDLSHRRRQVNPKKIYCTDSAIIYSYSIKPNYEKSASLENSVYLTLRHQKKDGIFYYKTASSKEVDFTIQEENGNLLLIQVCIDIEDEATRKREISALIEASHELQSTSLVIITLDKEETIQVEETTIKMLPFWKWALNLLEKFHEI